MESSPGDSSAGPSGTQRPRNGIPSHGTSTSHYSQSSYAPSRPFGVFTSSSEAPPRRSDAPSPTSRLHSLRRSLGRVFPERTPATELAALVPQASDAPLSLLTSTVNGLPTSTVNRSNLNAALSTPPPGSMGQTTVKQLRIETGTNAPPEHLAARIQSVEADACILHSECAIRHSDCAKAYDAEPNEDDVLVDMGEVSTHADKIQQEDTLHTDHEEQDEAYDDDDETEDEAFFDAYEEITEFDSDQPGSHFSADSDTSQAFSPPIRPAARPSTIPSFLLRAMADPSAGFLRDPHQSRPRDSATASSPERRASDNGPAAHQVQPMHRSPQGMPTPPTDRGSLGAEKVPPQPASPPRSPQLAGRSRPQPAEGALPQPVGRSLRPSVVSSLHRPQPPSLASLEHLLTPRNSIAHMRAAGRPALEPLREAYEFHLRTVPAGTKQVLHDVQYGAPDVAERAALRYEIHDADYLASDDWAMKKKQLDDIGGLVHSTRTVLHRYRYITLTVDTDAKRKDTAEWLDWVRLVKSTCDELKRKFRDCENMHLWAPDYLGKRKERLARYELQIIKTTEAIIKHKQREHNSTFEEARAVWHEQKQLFSENTRALEEDHEEFRMMRHILSEEAERASRSEKLVVNDEKERMTLRHILLRLDDNA